MNSFTNLVTLQVGSNPQQEFIVPKDLLRSTSGYFKRLLRDDVDELRQDATVFHHQEPEIFNIYLNWLYRKELPVQINDDPDSGTGQDRGAVENHHEPDDDKLEFEKLSKAYVLGDYILDENFTHGIVTTIYAKAMTLAKGQKPWPCDYFLPIQYIYDNTTEGSCLRDVVAVICASTVQIETCEAYVMEDPFPQECVRDILQKLIMLRERVEPFSPFSQVISPCTYHALSRDDDTSGYTCSRKRAHGDRKQRYGCDEEGSSSPRKRPRVA